MNKAERAQMYVSYLREEGYAPEVDKDGDVMFKFEGGIYYVLIDEEDEVYFRIVYPGFWPIRSEAERDRVIKAAMAATASTKVAKVFPVGDDVWADSELLCEPPEAFKQVMWRCIRSIRAAVAKFLEGMKPGDEVVDQQSPAPAA
ncbi:MAG TPA: hypothetical protein PLN42_11125 [Anaerolineae bacterium]|nr:hypothetical protein [Anaerolineae bacterium]